MRVRQTWATPDPEVSQVLVRQVRERGGWRRPAEYELAYFRDGRDRPPLWTREGSRMFSHIPGRTHPADLHDLRVLVEEAWAARDDGWIAWPVHHLAAIRSDDLRELTAIEAEAVATWRRTASTPGVEAGPFPVRLGRTRWGERVVDGLSHELIEGSVTRCGIDRAQLEVLDQTFRAGALGACPVCTRPA